MLHQTTLQPRPEPSLGRDDFQNGYGLRHAFLWSLGLFGSAAMVHVAATNGHPWLVVLAALPATLSILGFLGYAANLPFRIKSEWLRRRAGRDTTMAEYDAPGDRYLVCGIGDRHLKPMTVADFDTLRARIAADGGLLTLIYADRQCGEITLTRHRAGVLHGTKPHCPGVARLSRSGDRRWYYAHGTLLQGPDYSRGPPFQSRETSG